ncbi:BA75_01162T0 [Komagataella pastoris]|uniref:Protein transport protein SFT2 n=1 Tax=Komagataella pastoris TaxID=4922 RepID=A0A1B2J6T1_PICPA|nr:BA75_01162T0 [Komagataella pastoris]
MFKSTLNKIPGVNLGNDYSILPTTIPQRPEQFLPSPSSTFKSTFQKFNPFSTDGDITLDNEEVVTSDPGMFELSRWDRMLIFAVLIAGSVVCFIICVLLFPVLTLKPTKFALLWTMGSVFFLASFGVLQGAKNYFIHLTSAERLPFTVGYFASITSTLVFAVVLKSTILVILSCLVQFIAMIWYFISYFPGGKHGLRFTSGIARSQVESWMNS